MKKGYIQIVLALTLFTASMGFVYQEPARSDSTQEKPNGEVKPDKAVQEIRDNIEATKKIFDAELRKSDSLLVERQKNLNVLEKNVSDLKTANRVQERAINRLTYILKKFPKDSVLKFDIEYINTSSDSSDVKKKIEREIVPPTPKKKRFFRRIRSIFG